MPMLRVGVGGFPVCNWTSTEGGLGIGPAEMIACTTGKRDKCLPRFEEAPILFWQEVSDT